MPEPINLLLGVWMIICAVITPLFVRGRQDKLRGLTYKQVVWMCVGVATGGAVVVLLHFTAE